MKEGGEMEGGKEGGRERGRRKFAGKSTQMNSVKLHSNIML